MSGIVAQNINRQSGLIKAPEGGGSWTFIKKISGSGASTASFVDGASDVVLDSTYKEYLFYFVNVHPSAAQEHFQVNFSEDTGSNYNVTKTTTFFFSSHDEGDTSTSLSYQGGYDVAQGTGVQPLALSVAGSGDNDSGASGYLHLYNPSDTTFVKHFTAQVSAFTAGDYFNTNYSAGYCNTTSAVDAVQFTFASGNIDTGDIFLHGLTT